MSYRTCDHLKENGVYCDSPALRGQNFCYFHLSLRGRRLKMARALARGQACRLHLPVPEDMHAVQVSLSQVLDALADDRIEPARAGLMLYALQQASANLNGTHKWNGSRRTVAHDQPLRALEFPNFEQQYDLPEGVDLDLPPELALQTAGQKRSRKASKKRPRPARVPISRIERGEVLTSEEMTDARAMAWFFDRLGIKRSSSEVEEEEQGSAIQPQKPPQPVALDAPPAATIDAQTATICIAETGKVASVRQNGPTTPRDSGIYDQLPME